jgi:signal transduction histidine kinase
MEKLNTIPFYKRFGLRVFLFNAILALSVIVPTLLIRNMNYKDLIDRNSFAAALFNHGTDQFGGLHQNEWPAAMENFPKLFYQQRICLFNLENELVYDSGIMRKFDQEYILDLLLPDPYIDWNIQNDNFDPGVLIGYLKSINLADKVENKWQYTATKSIRYAEGIDRITIFARKIRSADGEDLIFSMSHSVVDILIHYRSVKERFLILYSLVILLCLLLTIIISWSVTSPLKKLYNRSKEILASKWRENDLEELPKRGEIGEICQALQSLIKEQKRQSENFMRFSSDIVHELKTPLAAIRSGLEAYSESTDEPEKEQVYDRINRRIQQMENLMNEIQLIGSIESNTVEERCTDIITVSKEILYELQEAEIELEIAPGIEGCHLPISCEKVYRILINLLKNAVGFSPEKGSVSVSLCMQEDFIIVQVRDRGPGIPEEVFSQITNRFFTYRPKNHEKHSGLGLSIIDAILRGCGGTMEYQNRTEGGAQFTCRIPTCKE